MAFYAVLAVFPTLLATAAALGFLDSLLGPGLADDVRTTVLHWIGSTTTAGTW